MIRKEPRLRIPVALAVVAIAAGSTAYGCSKQCMEVGTFGGGPSNPDGGQAGGAGGAGGSVVVCTTGDIA
jgi:hypothetical protein